ncbi:MAG: hypothetical protein H0W20_16700 [Chthoniobacterales bacterium]|nr:hypothetical protein [Chthoniobacterales bacterium]
MFSEKLPTALGDRFVGEAKRNKSAAILVSDAADATPFPSISGLKVAEFYDLLGGEVRTDRVLDRRLKEIMNDLGHNCLPNGFTGAPDTLLEEYSKECLQFLLECPVRRYGQERRFERLPDGLALGRNKFNIYFDAKAYEREFHPSADDIRRFASYVDDFNRRYSNYVGRISLFLVISGSFSKDGNAVREKINDMYAECSTPMAFIKSSDLAEAVTVFRKAPVQRSGINWRKVLAPQLFKLTRLKDEVKRIQKDAIITT